jgi:NDP-sugar pyrophosphorylase family protein
LDLILGHLRSQGIARVVLCTGYKADLVEDYYRERDFGLTIDFSREKEPLGTGGALKNAQEIISGDPFFVLNGDSFLPADFRAFLDFHKKKNALASILVSKAGKTKDFGSLRVDKSGQVIEFREKIEDAANRLVNAGIYCFDRKVFSRMPARAKFSLETDLFPKLAGQGFYGYRVDQEFIDIGTPERYASVKKRKF